MKKVFTITGRPTPSILCYPDEAQQIQNLPSLTVELICTQMGRTNRRRLDSRLWEEMRRKYGHLRIGGYTSGQPIERGTVK